MQRISTLTRSASFFVLTIFSADDLDGAVGVVYDVVRDAPLEEPTQARMAGRADDLLRHFGQGGMSRRNKRVAAAAPKSWATTKPGTSAGRMPAKVSGAERASVTAGLANEVEAVNQ